jgi:lysozyme
MKISNEGIELIKRWESFRSKPYKCAAGVWTIGYGHTRTASSYQQPITEQSAAELLKQDIEIFEAQLKTLALPVLEQCQYDAIVSLVFNIGTGNFKGSNTHKAIMHNPRSKYIADNWIEWRNGGGEYLRGLMRRRFDELKLYYSWK